MKVNRRILIPCCTVIESITKEQTDGRNVSGVIISGKLITCGVPTRNGISYTPESMNRFVQNFNQRGMTLPFLDSHDDSSIRKSPPFGHITKLIMQGPEVRYEANIDPEEKQFLHKLERGDIREVSLQAIVDAVDEQNVNGDNIITAEVRELLEVSSVLIPGARDTSAEIQGYLTEERFAETFHFARKHNISFCESLKLLRKEAKDENQKMGGQVEPTEEDLDTGNGAALIGDVLPKKIKKSAELLRQAKQLRIETWRFGGKHYGKC